MYPTGPDYRVIYSPVVQSFGVTRIETIEPVGELSFTDMPFEILQTIARYLDSFRYLLG